MTLASAMNGFTLAALASVRTRAVEKARANGVAVVAIRNSLHLGALSLDGCGSSREDVQVGVGIFVSSPSRDIQTYLTHAGKEMVLLPMSGLRKPRRGYR